jgi:hypothetical protein
LFQYSAFDQTWRMQHAHGDGKWEDMEEVSPSHDTAEGDPERSWGHGRVFRCTSCGEQFRLAEPDDAAPGHQR